MTLLAEDTDLWDVVFREPPARARFVEQLARDAGGRLLDVGCATGSFCRLLRRRGIEAEGVDINPRFIEAAQAKDPGGRFHVGDMRTMALGQTFDVVVCVGTTFCYNLSNREIAATLARLHEHVRPGGLLLLDVLNAIAFTGPRPFQPVTHHAFARGGVEATATIRHRLDLAAQTMTEQVTWRRPGQAPRRDPEESLRLLFPQELAFHLDTAGFDDIQLRGGFGVDPRARLDGRRLVAIARRPLHRKNRSV
ncbi:class I SAM-dependent methyltransferase [Roseateles chitinivorans]|uniref:class I SAM-dependent methyltransferase n=1 Tax=Roseateles chitinivorans TaxID=2917965 RepID=UPI003D67A252